MKEKNFGLSLEDFERLVADLRQHDTRFFERVFLKQFEETRRYLMRTCGAPADAAYDATMDTLLAFRRRFVAGKLTYGNLRFLFTQMARQQWLRNRKADSGELDPAILPIQQPPRLEEEESQWLDEAWQALDAECRSILTRHYYGKMKLTAIAEQDGQPAATLRKRKERCVKKLRAYFKNKAKLV